MSERTPLLGAPPASADASTEAQIETASSEVVSPNGLNDSTELTWLRTISIISALGLLIFLQASNVSMLTTIYDVIGEDLHAPTLVTWFTSTYLIASSSLGPLNGRFAIIFSPRNCISVSAIIFALGTLITGLAERFSTFILGRVFTGIGASGVLTVSIIVILDLSKTERRGVMIGALNTGFTIGVALGAVLGGTLTPVIGWRWMFLGQTPLAVFSGIVLYFAIPKTFTTGKQSSQPMSTQLARLDYLGAVSLTLTIVLFLFALSSPTKIPRLPLILSPFSLAIFVLIEVYLAQEPIIPVSLLKSRGLLLTCLGTVGFMSARWTVLFYTPTYTIALRGWSKAAAGSVLVPTNAGFAIGGLVVGFFHIRRKGSFYAATLATYFLFPLTLAWLASLMSYNSSVVMFILDVFLCGFMTGAALNYNLAHVLHLTPDSTHYIATSLLATFRTFSGSFGSAIGGGLFTRTLFQSLTGRFAAEDMMRDDLVYRLLGQPILVWKLEGIEKAIAIAGYQDALRTLYQTAALVGAVALLIQAGTGWRSASKEDSESEADA